jgi:UDP:flavonoid glycosyltransferase YjiC (YdhE family)
LQPDLQRGFEKYLMKRSIAVVSFSPDAGHVLPLLRIAAAFQDLDYGVVCYLPQECADYANYLSRPNFEFVSLGLALNDIIKKSYNEALLKLSRSSIFYNAFSRYMDLSDGYWAPLTFWASQQFTLVQSHLANQRPLFLLADDHVFRLWYVRLSQELETPLVLHASEGSYRSCQSQFVQVYGISRLPRLLQALVEYLGAASENLFRLRRLVRRFVDRKTMEGSNKDITEAVTLMKDRTKQDVTCQPIAISTGCGYLEQRHLKSQLRICDDLQVFGPLHNKTSSKLSSDLAEWLNGNGEPVVYISFGSMIRLNVEFVKAILDGLGLLGVRALWSMPKPQQDLLLPKLDIPKSAYFKEFVPPLEVLSMQSVCCSINHGGAGSVQDCLLSGKPMLCIPFMWDQPFNSSVVAHLQLGKRLSRQQVCAAMIAKTVGSLVSDKRIALCASNFAAELQQSRSETNVVEYILSRVSLGQKH